MSGLGSTGEATECLQGFPGLEKSESSSQDETSSTSGLVAAGTFAVSKPQGALQVLCIIVFPDQCKETGYFSFASKDLGNHVPQRPPPSLMPSTCLLQLPGQSPGWLGQVLAVLLLTWHFDVSFGSAGCAESLLGIPVFCRRVLSILRGKICCWVSHAERGTPTAALL